MIYRQEHPKPQFMRKNWQNLNGEWQFEIDKSVSGFEQGFYKNDFEYSMKINVPFSPESKLSGIGNVDFLNAVWYRKEISITEEQLNNRVILHFGAVDYEATIYINEQVAGIHKGGYVSFSFDITDKLNVGNNTICVRAKDDSRDTLIPTGKQSMQYGSYGCYYTRTTGIWQTVWLEFVPNNYIKKAKYFPNITNGSLDIEATVLGGGILKAEAFYEGKLMGTAEIATGGGLTRLHLDLAETHLWEIGKGRLYDLVLTFNEDRVESYFGLRSVRIDGYKFLLNEKSIFQRLVLDQGFYPDGIYTAPSDDALKNDIELSLAMGFNGARPHEKVFEERYLYYCDKLGYIVWGEYPNWGLDHTRPESALVLLPEWLEEIERDYNHPSIIGWCPFNETWDRYGRKQFDGVVKNVYLATKAIDPSRPCIDTSGNYHEMTDIYDVHDYEQNPEIFRSNYSNLPIDDTLVDIACSSPERLARYKDRQKYTPGLPVFISEYGGIAWSMDEIGWGYGNSPKSKEEFLTRLEGLTDAILENPRIMGLCYTQLTNVEQEQNGLYTYDREPKFDPDIISRFFKKKAAIED